jgi:peroxiredoxin Q/BCP
MDRQTGRLFLRDRLTLSAFAVLAVVAALFGASSAFAADAKVGQPAPAFEFQGVDGALHSSAELYGEQGVVVAWFPKAFTPG